LLQKGGHRRNK